jgi:hypothetical protein
MDAASYRGAVCWMPTRTHDLPSAMHRAGVPMVTDPATAERLGMTDGVTGFVATDAAMAASKAGVLVLDPSVSGGMWVQLQRRRLDATPRAVHREASPGRWATLRPASPFVGAP